MPSEVLPSKLNERWMFRDLMYNVTIVTNIILNTRNVLREYISGDFITHRNSSYVKRCTNHLTIYIKPS